MRVHSPGGPSVPSGSVKHGPPPCGMASTGMRGAMVCRHGQERAPAGGVSSALSERRGSCSACRRCQSADPHAPERRRLVTRLAGGAHPLRRSPPPTALRMQRSGSMSAFWRALTPWSLRLGGGGPASLDEERPPRPSLDDLGPSCSLGAPAPEGPPSPHRSDGGSGGDEAVEGCCVPAEAASLPKPPPLELAAPSTLLPPPVPPERDARPRRKRAPLAINARGSEAALRSTNPIRKARLAAGVAPASHASRGPVRALTGPRPRHRWWTPSGTCLPWRTRR